MLKLLTLLSENVKRYRLLQRLIISAAFCLCASIVLAFGCYAQEPSRKIIVGTEHGFFPFAYIDDMGIPQGFSVDLFQAVAKKMDLDFEFRTGTWKEVLFWTEAKQVDALPFVNNTERLDTLLDFTITHTVEHAIVIKRRDGQSIASVKELEGKNVLVKEEDGIHLFLAAHAPGARLFTTPTVSKALQRLAAGAHDYAVVPYIMGLVKISDMNLDNLQPTGEPIKEYVRPFSFGVQDGDTQTLAILNQGLNLVKESGEYDLIYNEWFGEIDPRKAAEKFKNKLLLVISAVMLAVLIAAAWLATLRRTINQQKEKFAAEIERRKNSEEKLRLAELKYRTVADFAYDWEYWCNDDGSVKYVSPSCERISGYTPQEFHNNPSLFRKIIVPEDKDIWDKHFCDSRNYLKPQEVLFRLQRRDGKIRWIEHVCQPVIDNLGTNLGFRASNRDITEQKLTEEALVESEEKFRTLAADNGEIVFILDKKGTFVLSEGKGLSKLGLQAGQVVGKSVFDLYKDYPPMLDQIREALLGKTIVAEDNVDGNHFISWYRPRENQSGEITGISGLWINITERKEAEFEFQKSLGEVQRLKELHEKESLYLREEINLEHNYKNIIGNSTAIQYVLLKVEQVAETDASVLIMGETGTGKELVARAIHNNSLRKDRPLFKINCAALPANFIESALFGHEKGSFKGAISKHTGLFEVAHGSSIFLDEIGELPFKLQKKLLKVIEDGEFESVGSSMAMKADVRIIAATNRDLEKEIRAGRFHQDLWYRLNAFPITVPTLRDRIEDIPLIVQHYVDKFARKHGKGTLSVPTEIMTTLQSYSWPGNVRELENILERAVISTTGSSLTLEEKLEKDREEVAAETFKSLHDMERNYIIRVLENTNWKVSGKNSAAEILRLDRSTLRAKMKKMDINKPQVQ